MKKLLMVYLAVIVAAFLVSCSSEPWNADVPKHYGPNEIVGTTKIVLDDPRRLLLQVWYPAENEGAGVLDPMIAKEQLNAMVGMNLPIGKEALENHLPSSSYANAPVRKSGMPYPVIIFNHGFEGYEKQNMTQMEELASYGFVVVAVNHPGESTVTLYPDGEIRLIDHERYPSLITDDKKLARERANQTREFIEDIRNAESDEDKIDTMRVFSAVPRVLALGIPIGERTQDILYVLDYLVRFNTTGPTPGLLDLDNVGMFGHSMGGNVTHAIASMENLPVTLRAAANLDGPQLIFPGEEVTIPGVPFLMAYSTDQYVDGVTVDLHGANDWVLNLSDQDTCRVVINGANHLNFSDLTYFEFLEGKSTGKIEGTAMGLSLESLLVAWFRRYLKNEEVDFATIIDGYPLWEVDYRRKPLE